MPQEQRRIQYSRRELVDFNQLTFPPAVYKYRVWDNVRHKTILTERQVFFAPPTSFEDPKDCKNPLRYDLLKEKDIYNKYLLASQQDFPQRTRQQHRKFARDWTKRSPLKNRAYVARFQEETFIEFDRRFGVLSLTSKPDNNEMHVKYGADHTGFCVGFDPRIMFRFFGGGGKVEYVEELPIIMPTPIHEQEFQHELLVFRKEAKWKFEDEYRTHRFWENPVSHVERTIVLPANAYTEIIFGARMTNGHKAEITALAERLFPGIRLRQCLYNDGTVTIVDI
jgi:hypothetical protein